jgi:translation initiation factor 2 alpha subunit (eIF-2alpha)
MAERKPEFPEPGDLVIATIETVTYYGAYAKRDEFGRIGVLHLSEICSSCVNVSKAGGQGAFGREK